MPGAAGGCNGGAGPWRQGGSNERHGDKLGSGGARGQEAQRAVNRVRGLQVHLVVTQSLRWWGMKGTRQAKCRHDLPRMSCDAVPVR